MFTSELCVCVTMVVWAAFHSIQVCTPMLYPLPFCDKVCVCDEHRKLVKIYNTEYPIAGQDVSVNKISFVPMHK